MLLLRRRISRDEVLEEETYIITIIIIIIIIIINLFIFSRTKSKEFKNYISKLIWNEHQSGWSSTQKTVMQQDRIKQLTNDK